MTDPKSSPHQVLGVPVDATVKQIRKAYKKLARQYHPDRNPSQGHDPGSARRFIAVKAAHDEMLRRIQAGEIPRATASHETIRPPPHQVRPQARSTREPRPRTAVPIEWEEEEVQPTLWDLWRPALYLGSALVWIFALWMFSSTMQQVAQVLAPGGYRPPAASSEEPPQKDASPEVRPAR